MKKQFVIIGIAVLLLAVGLSGCTNTGINNDKESDGGENNDDFLNDAENGQSSDHDDDGNWDELQTYIDSDGDGYYDYEDDFPYDSSEWRDSDNDGYGNNADAFPYDSSEWKDSDGDGRGDNSDIYPYDYDNDGFADSVDINKYGDGAIKISLNYFSVIDEVDVWPFGNAEVFFEMYIDDRLEARIDSNGKSWSAIIGETYSVTDWIVYNIDDDQRYTTIRIVMWDNDGLFENDYIDIDGTSSSKTLDIVFDAVTETWSGDDSDGYTDGSDDGSSGYDDDDGALWYNIEVTEVEYDKTYEWSYGYNSYSLHVEIPKENYAYYKHLNVDRSPYPYSQGSHFVTSDDTTVTAIANELNSMAQSKGFDYYEKANFVLKFVQSLQYSFDNETTSWNDYWRYPIETLVDEGGDCEDTSILYASIMEAMGYDAVLLLPPAHMAVGIEGLGCSGVEHNGITYCYCETTNHEKNLGDIPQIYQGKTTYIVQVE
ncbi:MAG: hypothetical protein KAV40_02310 [Thermoplasmatales archaeon]|nr:hypothetical protein [Thermoplasmatales archaeon]